MTFFLNDKPQKLSVGTDFDGVWQEGADGSWTGETRGRERKAIETHRTECRPCAMAMAVFVSRSEDSGTHKKELTLWKAAGIAVPDELETYVKANKGMRETLELAAARKGYVLTDRGTLLSFQTEGGNADRLSILLEGSELLRNQYGIIALNPEKCAHANHDLAREFIDWITSEEGQSAIGNFRLQGHQLFSPNA